MKGKLSAEVCAVGAKMVAVRGGGKESSLGESGKKTGGMKAGTPGYPGKGLVRGRALLRPWKN